jgi:membrane protein DedA with SNARE-associated domain
MHFLIEFLQFIQPYGTWSYALILAVLLACGFGLPMPEDITLVTAGILASRGIVDFDLIIFTCMIGVLGGDGIVFTLGHTIGQKVLGTKMGRILLPQSRDEKVKKLIQKYGDKIIFMARFMPGFRTPLFFATGTYKVPYWKFLALDGFAAVISVPLWIYVGYLFGANLEELEIVIRQFQFFTYALIGGLLLLFVTFFILRRKKTDHEVIN